MVEVARDEVGQRLRVAETCILLRFGLDAPVCQVTDQRPPARPEADGCRILAVLPIRRVPSGGQACARTRAGSRQDVVDYLRAAARAPCQR